MDLFGVKLGDEKRQQIFRDIDSSLSDKQCSYFIVTLNNEILLKAKNDGEYRKIINKADLKVVDSIGIRQVSYLKRKKVGERLAGADLAEYILKKAIDENLFVGAIIPSWGWSKKSDVEQVLSNCLNSIVITKEAGKDGIEKDIRALCEVEILFVGLGAPYQEKYIWKIKEKLPKLKLAIGVGGTFDYWTGKKKRAPKFMRKVGLEWLWRFIIQPNRAVRIFNALILFPFYAMTENYEKK